MIQTIKVNKINEICHCSLCLFEALNEREFLHHLKFKHKLILKDARPFIRCQSPLLHQPPVTHKGKISARADKKTRTTNSAGDENQLGFSTEALNLKVEIVEDQDLLWANRVLGDNEELQLDGELQLGDVEFVEDFGDEYFDSMEGTDDRSPTRPQRKSGQNQPRTCGEEIAKKEDVIAEDGQDVIGTDDDDDWIPAEPSPTKKKATRKSSNQNTKGKFLNELQIYAPKQQTSPENIVGEEPHSLTNEDNQLEPSADELTLKVEIDEDFLWVNDDVGENQELPPNENEIDLKEHLENEDYTDSIKDGNDSLDDEWIPDEASPPRKKTKPTNSNPSDVGAAKRSPKRTKKDLVKCQFCTTRLMSPKCYQQHFNKHHDKTAYACNICQTVIISQFKYQVHVRRVHPLVEDGKDVKAYMCDRCPATFKQERSLRNHRRIRHENKLKSGLPNIVKDEQISKPSGKKCQLCRLTNYMTPEMYENHFDKYHDETVYLCEFCNTTSISKHKYQNHLKYAHQHVDEVKDTFENIIACKICGKSVLKNCLKRHIKSAHAEMDGQFECPHCEKIFINTFRLKSHIKFMHEQKNFLECEICGKKFMQKRHLQRHIDGVHKKLRPFECKICGNFYSQTASLQLHQKKYHKSANPTESEAIVSEGSTLNNTEASLPVPDES